MSDLHVVEGNFPQQHEHCWHTTIDTTTGNPASPMHCCYCNEQYRVHVPLSVTTQQHGPYAR